VLAAADIHAHNTFAEPRAVVSRDLEAKITAGANTLQFPPASVTRLELELA
jgi:alpha-N-arabinofuranosidase